jgi:L-aspartate oxidase
VTTIETDVLVIGSGIAGLTFALRVADRADVVLVTKKASLDSNTNYAQGGIAAVLDRADSFANHMADTLRAGAGLCHPDRVEVLVRSGPQAIADLVAWGVEFSRQGGGLALGIEGGHSRARIAHSRDQTGAAIETSLDRAVAGHPRIRLLEDHMVLALDQRCVAGKRRCGGAWVLDIEAGRLVDVRARFTMLATGGTAAIYRHTTNPAIATGDGIALAYRAGAVVGNLEFIQFHPTALYPAEEHAFLISEAVRGEGAVLRNAAGEAFMTAYDPRADLAPRDVVARAVHAEMKKSGAPHVWLDATRIPTQKLEERFPHILKECLSRGSDPRREPLPVVPAAHYMCGGVWTDADARTTLPGLLAAGECACTGVHGANRLASNSLLEAVVFGERAAARMVGSLDTVTRMEAAERPPQDLSGLPHAGLAEICQRVKGLMWDHLGISRSLAEMQQGTEMLAELRREWAALRAASRPSGDGARWAEAAEVLNVLDVAGLALRCAVWRRESRGLHFVTDYPYRNNEDYLRDSLVVAAE